MNLSQQNIRLGNKAPTLIYSEGNKVRITNKSLTFQNSTTTKTKTTQKNTFEHINASTGNIGNITSDNIIATQNISSPEGLFANILFNHNNDTNTSYIQNLSNNLIFKINNAPDSINITKNGDVIIKNLKVTGNINMVDGMCSGDLEANNINLLGDVTATAAYLTNELRVEGHIIGNSIYITNNIDIDGTINAKQNIITNNLVVKNKLYSADIETNLLGSRNDLAIVAGTNRSVNIPNIRYGVDNSDIAIIDPSAIKSIKIFVVTKNILLPSDETCNGIEIIIYNQNRLGKIIIRDRISIIDNLEPQCAVKLVYIYIVDKWIKL
jgi:cytoskeletal protein CcmA (bactofilin family)